MNLRRGATIALACETRTTFGLSTHKVSSQRSLSRRLMASNSGSDVGKESKTCILKVLALHGSGGTAQSFCANLQSLEASLNDKHGVSLDINSIAAPYPKEDGFSWWTMPPGVRSSTATEYIGFQESSDMVISAMSKTSSSSQSIDLIVAHSQGAILMSALLALKELPYFPPCGIILNGVAYPNPYGVDLDSLVGDATDSKPRVLFVMGDKDRINPPSGGNHVMRGLEKAQIDVSCVSHPGGHSFPAENVEAIDKIASWIARNSSG